MKDYDAAILRDRAPNAPPTGPCLSARLLVTAATVIDVGPAVSAATLTTRAGPGAVARTFLVARRPVHRARARRTQVARGRLARRRFTRGLTAGRLAAGRLIQWWLGRWPGDRFRGRHRDRLSRGYRDRPCGRGGDWSGGRPRDRRHGSPGRDGFDHGNRGRRGHRARRFGRVDDRWLGTPRALDRRWRGERDGTRPRRPHRERRSDRRRCRGRSRELVLLVERAGETESDARQDQVDGPESQDQATALRSGHARCGSFGSDPRGRVGVVAIVAAADPRRAGSGSCPVSPVEPREGAGSGPGRTPGGCDRARRGRPGNRRRGRWPRAPGPWPRPGLRGRRPFGRS